MGLCLYLFHSVSKLLSICHMKSSGTVRLAVVTFMCGARCECLCLLPHEGTDLP
jgi:hypothetical protein